MDKVSEFTKNVKNCLIKSHSPSKEEFGHFSLIFKQIIGIITGIVFGAIGVTGIVGILLFLAISTGLMMYYSKNYLHIDEDEIENHKMFTESTLPSLALFMLCWVMTYSISYHAK